MRLIDADELPEVNTIERIEGDREVFVNSWVPATAIWKAPTVKAIPIDWLLEQVIDDLDLHHTLCCLWERWKENESGMENR